MRSRGAAEAYRVEIAPSLGAVLDEWERLAESGAALPFQRRDWLEAWAETLGREPRTIMLPTTVRDQGGRAVLALPLVLRRDGPLRTIAFADGGLSDYNAPILGDDAPGTAETAHSLWRAIRAALPAADVIRFEKMPEQVLGRRNPLTLLPAARPSLALGLALSLPSSYEAWRAQLPTHFRKEIGRCGRLFDALPGAAVQFATGGCDDPDVLDPLERLQRERIDELGLPYALDREAPRALYRHLAATSRSSVLTSLAADGAIVAALFGLRQGSSFVMLRLGIADQRYRHISPGRHLITQTMKHLAEDGVTRFDFGLGDYAYKRKLGGTPVPLVDLVVAASPLGLGPFAIDRLRRSLSPETRLGAAARRIKARWTTRR